MPNCTFHIVDAFTAVPFTGNPCAVVTDADGIEPETVTAVFQKGYKYGDRVLRPAMVKVAN